MCLSYPSTQTVFVIETTVLGFLLGVVVFRLDCCSWCVFNENGLLALSLRLAVSSAGLWGLRGCRVNVFNHDFRGCDSVK